MGLNEDKAKSVEIALAQLRHLYSHMISRSDSKQNKHDIGLVHQAIVLLERSLR